MVNIKVAVRIRPMSFREESQREEAIVRNNEKCILVTNPKVGEAADSRQRVRRFAVDYCYDPAYPDLATQEAVYEEIGSEILSSMFEGYNGCVLAYGHSASGKTYTMMGDDDNPGLTPRICRGLCQMIQDRGDVTTCIVVSFLEIYNEKVQDLLVDEDVNQQPGFSLRVREHPKLGPYVQDLSEHEVDNERDLLRLLAQGNRKRSTAATESNIHSSRSHAVFTIKFKQIGEHTAKSSKVHLVDLAGSERASAVQSRARLKEGANINKSLVTLGNVISALADCSDPWGNKGWQPFVPYRDSVLTWLLKDTLGGNSNTIMIATVSPAGSCYNDTINTLRYAKRTKKIVNQPIINEDPKIRTIRELRDEVSRLKTMLQSLANVALQTEDVDFPLLGWNSEGANMEDAMSSDQYDLLDSSIRCQEPLRQEEGREIEVPRNIATLDILPTSLAGKQSSSWATPTNPVPPHVSEINAENATGVNRVIAEPECLQEPYRRCEALARDGLWRCDVPRVLNRTLFKRKRVVFRRSNINSAWTMLHRSRPDLIKGISTRPNEAPSTSSQSFVDQLSQSASENSLLSSGSAESHSARPRPHISQNLSRGSSVGDASGSSTPTQTQKPVIRKKEAKRAEIVASVTSRLYAIKKKPDPRMEALQAAAEKEEDDDDELEELKLCKRARMKLFDLSRKLAMAKKLKRTVDSDTQTEILRSTLRVKEKCIATDQQGILHVLHTTTNTQTDADTQDNTVVMNQVYLPNGGNFILECGPSIRLAVPNSKKSDSSSQTNPESRDQTTSPKKGAFEIPEEGFSDDSLDSDALEERTKKLAPMFYSCRNLTNEYASYKDNYQNLSNLTLNHFPFETRAIGNKSTKLNLHQKRSIDSLLGKFPTPGVRIEKSLQPISRYVINGTNALYEYDPNKLVADKIVYSSNVDEKHYSSGASPAILYPQYKPELFNGFPLGSSETVGSSEDGIIPQNVSHIESTEDNFSSNTSSASTASSSASDTSSDDFVFFNNPGSANPKSGRELYTISENSEPSCSNQSTPLTSRSPRIDIAPDDKEANANNIGKIKFSNDNNSDKVSNIMKHETNSITEQGNNENNQAINSETKENSKKVNWAEMQCQPNRKFLNFNFKPAFFNDTKHKDQSIEAHFPSEDSITLVFLGPKQQDTSILLELIRRSLNGGSDTLGNKKCHQSRSRGIQCSSKMMRSVSVDTAMIALSRLARQQRPTADISRTNSLNFIYSDENITFQDDESMKLGNENGTQCDLPSQVDESTMISPSDTSCQCNLDEIQKVTYSSATNTTTDQGTETDPQKSEAEIQTDDIEKLFDDKCPELPRVTVSDSRNADNKEQEEKKWLEIKQMILGSKGDLFPNYLESYITDEKRQKKQGKSVSWSDLGKDPESEGSINEEELERNNEAFQFRKVRFKERQDKLTKSNRSSSPSQRHAVAAISSFITEATSLLQKLNQPQCHSSSDSENSEVDNEKLSKCSLLRRRTKKLPKIKVNCGTQNELTQQTETSVQTDVEKTDKPVQAGSYAASLVGPPVKRPLTPNLKPESANEQFNMTWPRRRISAKPPTGLKPGSSPRSLTPARSGSFSSRISNCSTNWTAPSHPSSSRTSPRRSPTPVSSIPDYRDLEPDWQMEESCKRLELAILKDRSRQEHFSSVMSAVQSQEDLRFENISSKMHTSDNDDSLKSTFEHLSRYSPIRNFDPTLPKANQSVKSRRRSFETEGNIQIQVDALIRGRNNRVNEYKTPEFESRPLFNDTLYSNHSFKDERDQSYEALPHTTHTTLYKTNYTAHDEKTAISRIPDYLLRPIRSSYEMDRVKNNYMPINIKGIGLSSKEEKESIYPIMPRLINQNKCRTNSLTRSWSMHKRKDCNCACHNINFSCNDLDFKMGIGHCHTCCVPCPGEKNQLSRSEPVLTSPKSSPIEKSRYTPSAYLKYLVSLRRNIVAGREEKAPIYTGLEL